MDLLAHVRFEHALDRTLPTDPCRESQAFIRVLHVAQSHEVQLLGRGGIRARGERLETIDPRIEE